MPIDARLADVARVVGYHLESQRVAPGGERNVTIYWEPLARTVQPYTVFVHLYEPSVGSIAQRDTYPGLGNYATVVWDPGRVFADTYRIYLPAEAPGVENATILLGLYDEATGERLPVKGSDAGPADMAWTQFGSVAVVP